MTGKRAFCDAVHRRDLLRLGVAGSLGGALPLSHWLQAGAMAEEGDRGLSVIFLFLRGGLSTIDTFDMKPEAPVEFRGEFDPIPSCLPGVPVCEHLPRTSQQLDKFSLIRSFAHGNSNHGQADHYMLTGYPTGPGFNSNISFNNQRPAHGSAIARTLGPRGSVPPYVCLPQVHKSAGPAYLGPACAPLGIEANPNAPDFQVPDIVPPLALKANRLDDRRGLLRQVDRFQRSGEQQANSRARTVSAFREKAFELMTSPQAKRAFNIHQEEDSVREAYGRNTLGQSCLLARRLVEAGVRCVTVDHSNWDTHDNNFAVLREELLPTFDRAISTLFVDLAERGILEKTLVIVSGEFGRTPRINKNAGRDHWGPAFTVAVGGGGIQGGRVIGATNERAEKPVTTPYGPEDLSATMYHLLGVNYEQEFRTPEGRPIKLVNNGKVIRDLL